MTPGEVERRTAGVAGAVRGELVPHPLEDLWQADLSLVVVLGVRALAAERPPRPGRGTIFGAEWAGNNAGLRHWG